MIFVEYLKGKQLFLNKLNLPSAEKAHTRIKDGKKA